MSLIPTERQDFMGEDRAPLVETYHSKAISPSVVIRIPLQEIMPQYPSTKRPYDPQFEFELDLFVDQMVPAETISWLEISHTVKISIIFMDFDVKPLVVQAPLTVAYTLGERQLISKHETLAATAATAAAAAAAPSSVVRTSSTHATASWIKELERDKFTSRIPSTANTVRLPRLRQNELSISKEPTLVDLFPTPPDCHPTTSNCTSPASFTTRSSSGLATSSPLASAEITPFVPALVSSPLPSLPLPFLMDHSPDSASTVKTCGSYPNLQGTHSDTVIATSEPERGFSIKAGTPLNIISRPATTDDPGDLLNFLLEGYNNDEDHDEGESYDQGYESEGTVLPNFDKIE
ncbi:hypothetical protein BGZ83_007206 [Gryganskiella cystojenkinii]|nr:hypothetical protein BGZ83_007206 [Gryganskiella cystojenkinii]